VDIEQNNLTPIRVLIVSDRLIDEAQKLADYLAISGVKVIALVNTKEQALEFCDQRIDFLIVAGYLKNRQTYKVIEEYKNRQISFIPVHWAMLDDLIAIYCNTYKIPLQFERTLPMFKFVVFLEKYRN